MNTINGTIKTREIEDIEIGNYIGQEISIHGSIAKIRKMSHFAFVILRTKRSLVQCIYSEEFSNFSLEDLKEESCVIVTANVIEEKRSTTGFDLHMTGIEVLSVPEEPSPVVINNKKVDASIDSLLNYRPLTLRNEQERAIFKLQEGICNGFRNFLLKNSFVEIHSPKIVASGAEGGSNIFRLDYFGKEVYLTQSPQFYKQMMVGVFERVFEIAPVFRAEKHDTSRHLNEYISVDFEMGYIRSFEEIMHMETRMIIETLKYLQENYQQEIQRLKVRLPEVTEIPAIKFQDAKVMVAREYGREIKDFLDFEPEEEKLLSELVKKTTGSDFVFVTHYPSAKRPFYAMESQEDQEETLSFDLLFRGLEITTGGQRIHNYKEQIKKMNRLGMHPELFESYLMAHKCGLPPHGGLGLGLERFTAKLLDMDNVRYATLFPRDINRVTP
jgi:nondiscriminating aspartyl-tRNA synthetase